MKRYQFQFSLTALFIVITFYCILFAAIGYAVNTFSKIHWSSFSYSRTGLVYIYIVWKDRKIPDTQLILHEPYKPAETKFTVHDETELE